MKKHAGMKNHSHKEGMMTEAIENETAKLPSGAFLSAALGAMAISLILKCVRRKNTSLFIGQWAAPLLIMGLYNKLVKTEGHD